MEIIKRTIKGKQKRYKIYTREEFSSFFPDKTPIAWHQATREGEDVVTDDGYVCSVIRVLGPYKGRGSLQLVLPFCRVWTSRTKQLHFLEYYGKGHYSQTKAGTWLDSELGKTRIKRVIHLYAMLLLKKGKVTREDQLKLAKLYRPDQKEPIATFKRMLKQPKVKQQITMELEKILNDEGITSQYVVRKYKEVYQDAKSAEHTATMKSVVDKFAEMLGMTGKNAQRQLPEGTGPSGDETEIFGMLQQSEEFIEAPDDAVYIDEVHSAKTS